MYSRAGLWRELAGLSTVECGMNELKKKLNYVVGAKSVSNEGREISKGGRIEL